MQGIFSSSSNIFSDSILILQWVIFFALFGDWFVARKRNIKVHKKLILTLFIVQTVFNLYMLSRILTQQVHISALIIIHGTLGFFAYLLILYTILFMMKKLPESLRFKFITLDNRIWLMRLAMVVWMFFTISGTLVYASIYLTH